MLSVLLAEFKEKRLGEEELQATYRGLAPAELRSICTADGRFSEVDFGLAMKELDEHDLVKTGPLEAYDNPPGSSVFILALYSKNEYSYLTEDGYKLATRLGTRPPRLPAPSIHISGGTFHQSPVAVGSQVSQTVNISASSNELLARLRKEVQDRVVEDQKRSEIMLHIDALEEAQGKPSIIERYNKLVGVIGDHVTVFGPVLTLLLQRLMGS